MRTVLTTTGLLLVVMIPVRAAAQHEGHTVGAAPASVSGDVISTCIDAQRRSLQVLDAVNQRADASRQTNSAAEMRAAMADVQRALLSARTELGRCAALEQTAATAAPAAAQAMPGMPGMPGMPAAPGVTDPTTGAVAPAAGPHAGHVPPTTPRAPSTPASRAATPAAAADPHVAHGPPPAAPENTPPAAAGRPSTPAAAPDSHGGHVTPSTPAGGAAAAPEVIVDPVSKASVDPKTSLRVLHQGKMYYFRSDRERQEFMKNPGKYTSAK